MTPKCSRRWKLEGKEWVKERSQSRDWTWADRPTFDQPLRSLRLAGPWGYRSLTFSTRGDDPPLRAELTGRDGPADGLLVYGFTSVSQLTPPAVTYILSIR